MEIVIKIDEKLYNRIKYLEPKADTMLDELMRCVQNGKPLPKGHGRLIDANRLRSMYSINRANFNTVVGIQKWIDNAPTIIEAEGSDAE